DAFWNSTRKYDIVHIQFPEVIFKWRQPSDNDENNPNNTPVGQKNYHLFLTFDVESIGRFEVDMYALGENINLSLLYPEKFGFKIKKLTDKIDLIIRNIGYKPAKFETAVLRKPHVLTEVFPKIIDRRKGLNVQA
ncbi:hypothetical protein OBE_15343, partial [human gut metagenome]